MLIESMVDQAEDRWDGYEPALTSYELEECVFNWNSYVRKRLPVDYPAGGIVSWLRKGLEVTIWHGGSADPPPDIDAGLHFVIEQRGSNHHLEYKLYVFMKKDGTFSAHFRGVFGVFRMRKLQAMLMLAGVPASCVQRRVCANGIDQQIDDDLQGFDGCEIAIVGGLSGVAEQATWIQRRVVHHASSGRLVSYEVATVSLGVKSIRLGLLTYPYGDLCGRVGRALRVKGIKVPIFVGSAGSLVPGLARGDTSCPSQIFCDELTRSIDVQNLLEKYHSWDSCKKGHCSVQTPLQESGRFVAKAVRADIGTADCEVYSFLEGWGVKGYAATAAVALFVTDEAWRLEKDVSRLSYGRATVRAAGAACFEAVGKLLRADLS
jgi:hypothetical protein